MFKTFVLVLLFCLGGIVITHTAFAQAAADSSGYKNPLYANIQNSFYKAIGSQSRLYNGKRYEFYDRAILSNAYFMDNADWSAGSVIYDGYLYEKVDLIYDLFKDQLVTHLYHSFLKISLINDEVKSFNMLGHHFIHLNNDPANSSAPKAGFYDELYGGKIAVLAKRQKTMQNSHNVSGEIETYFTPETAEYYLYKNGVYYSVGSEGSFLDVLKDKKTELQQYIRANKIKYRKNREQAMAMIADHYDHLSQ